MMRTGATLCLLTMFCACTCAQETAKDGPDDSDVASADTQQPSGHPPPDPEAVRPAPQGDVIALKSGAVLKGLQIRRETLSCYVVVIIEDSLWLRVPRAQVRSVAYDAYDPPGKRTPESLVAHDRGQVLLPGQMISPHLMTCLTTDISDPPLKCQQTDFLAVLEEVATRARLRINVDESVKAMPHEERLWTYHTPPGATVQSLLDSLVTDVQSLKIVFREDSVLLTDSNPSPANG